jgi:hypothetical protein
MSTSNGKKLKNCSSPDRWFDVEILTAWIPQNHWFCCLYFLPNPPQAAICWWQTNLFCPCLLLQEDKFPLLEWIKEYQVLHLLGSMPNCERSIWPLRITCSSVQRQPSNDLSAFVKTAALTQHIGKHTATWIPKHRKWWKAATYLKYD